MSRAVLKSSVVFSVPFLCLALAAVDAPAKAAPQHHNLHQVKVAAEEASAKISLSTSEPSITEPASASNVSNVSVTDTSGARYRSDFQTWWLTQRNGTGIDIEFDLAEISGVLLTVKNAYVTNSGGTQTEVNIFVNGEPLDAVPLIETNSGWHDTALDIPDALLKPGTNTVSFQLARGSAAWFMQEIDILPTAVDPPQSYADLDLSTPTPTVTQPTGTSSIAALAIADTNGASYRTDFRTWWLTDKSGYGLALEFGLEKPTMLQLAVRNAYVTNSGGDQTNVNILVNGQLLGGKPHVETNSGWHETLLDIPSSMLVSGKNTIEFALAQDSAAWFMQSVALLPRNLYAVDGELTTTLYAQFGLAENRIGVSPNPKDPAENPECTSDSRCQIWTRSYGLSSTKEMLPGPTLFYNPGDLLTVNLVNLLDSESLKQFEQGQADNINKKSDETLDNVADAVRQEVNIPHNLNNTNLHVHGLHVDPGKDDVTIVIVPESEAGTVAQYDAPHDIPTTPEEVLQNLNEGSVSDQAVKPGQWAYQYRIPDNHLPGTHWFHPHKHGSTAAQVENGMAGSMVIQEPEGLEIFPGSRGTEWEERFDTVMMIQQIANYGLQQGSAGGKEASKNTTAGVTVVNGELQPEIVLPAGQVVRWRFVNAGANHKTFNQMWLGRDTGQTDAKGQPIFVSEPIYAVAFDGITVSEKGEATAESPFLLAPGNRVDIVFKAPTSMPDGTTYTLFKYYPTDISIVDRGYYDGGTDHPDILDHLIWDCGGSSCAGSLDPAQAPVSNPYLFKSYHDDPTDENFNGFNLDWVGTNTTQPTSQNLKVPTVPLIKVAEDSNGFLDLNFALSGQAPTAETCADGCAAGLWQTQLDSFGGGAIKAEAVMSVRVDNSLVPIGPGELPTDSYLSTISPTGSFSKGMTVPGYTGGIPSYVNKFEDGDILQSRTVTFDKSGASIKVVGKDPGSAGTAVVNQFTLNGRPFALDDMIGNSTKRVDKRLSHGVTTADLKSVPTGNSDSKSAPDSDQCTQTDGTACLEIVEDLSFSQVSTNWSNGVCLDEDCATDSSKDTYYWANPSYYQAIEYVDENGLQGFRYKRDNVVATWTDVSGLKGPAAVNTNYSKGNVTGNINGLPGLPIAQTGEEWILINNSDIGHPFHIHINPFFVLEVGQLSYETFEGGEKQWLMRAVNWKDNLPEISSSDAAPKTPGVYAGENDVKHFVGNWWDTVIVPPHGYIKVRYWMNVPHQSGEDAEATVEDNSNKIGIWVYHCHILRHEDRGMMMPVVTQQLMPADSAIGEGK